MNPKIWGPKGWFFIHAIALNYPNNPTFQQKKEYSNFFKTLKYVLPCHACAKNYGKNIDKYPIDNYLDTTETLFNWTVDLHNMVNMETGKPHISYTEAYNLHMKNYNENNVPSKNVNIENISKKYEDEIENISKNNSINMSKQASLYRTIIISIIVIAVIFFIINEKIF